MMLRKTSALLLASCLPLGGAFAADAPLQWSELPIVRSGKTIGRAPMPAISVAKFCHSNLTMCMTITKTCAHNRLVVGAGVT